MSEGLKLNPMKDAPEEDILIEYVDCDVYGTEHHTIAVGYWMKHKNDWYVDRYYSKHRNCIGWLPLPTGEEQARIAALEAENAALKARVAELETPDMFWDADDPADGLEPDDPEKLALGIYSGMSPEVISLSCAHALPGLHYLCFAAQIDEDDFEARAIRYTSRGEAEAARKALMEELTSPRCTTHPQETTKEWAQHRCRQ